MRPTHFALVGGGWRAEFYLRIAQALPERFTLDGLVVRDAVKGARLEAAWGVRTYRTLDALLGASSPAFVVTCVSWAANPGFVRELASRGIPVLSETPPAPDLEAMRALWSSVRGGPTVQVAEQYIYQPHHAARLVVVRSGALGRVSQAQVSAAHGYHGISLIRHLLGLGHENVTIRAREFVSPLVAGPNRQGPPEEERLTQSRQTIAWLDWGDRLGVFDFAGDQYFSWIRNERVLVRGERGEINNLGASVLEDYRTPVESTFRRVVAGAEGNLEGLYLKGYLLEDRWVYRNPFVLARLTDDEIAVATSLDKMADHLEGGAPPYPLAEACQDHYLSLLVARAETGEEVRSETQPWAM